MLRLAHDDDVPRMIARYRDTIHRVNAEHYNAAQLVAWAPEVIDETNWRSRIANYYVAVTESRGGELTGFAELGDGGYIDCFFVSADHQRAGIGCELMTDLEQRARGRGDKLLYANVSITAKPFFERCGFVVVREQQVELRGEQFRNFRMEKQLA